MLAQEDKWDGILSANKTPTYVKLAGHWAWLGQNLLLDIQFNIVMN